MDPNKKVLDYIRDTAEYVRTPEGSVSASVMLDRFLFPPVVQQQLIKSLSGGEKKRLYLLRVLMEEPNFLILDEPANDLDIRTMEVLEDYLDRFEGIVVTVSHDRYFLDRCVRRMFAFEENHTLRQYEGGYSDYAAVKQAEEEEKQRAEREKEKKKQQKAEEVTKKPAREQKLRFSYLEQREYNTIEEDIQTLEETIEQLEKDMDAAATDFVRLRELSEKKEQSEALLEQKMERWVYLSMVPNPANFSWMTVVTAMGQMFYSLSIAMGILVTFGSYMKKDVSIEGSTKNVEIFDTLIAMMAGLMIIPAVFSFSGGDPDTLQAGPALMFITIPKVFESMELGSLVGVLFFVLVLFAAVTSSIALTESAVSTFEDELGWSRKKAAAVIGIIMVLLGSLSALGYGPLSGVTVIGMQFLDFFDFLTNSVMMPIAAIATCLLVTSVIGVEKIEEEVTQNGQPFRRKKVFNFMIRTLCPVFAAIILVSSVANALGWISM